MPVSPTDPVVASLSAAIGLQEGVNVSGSIPNRNNNPGDLKNSNLGYPVDSFGHTIFPDYATGNAALQHQAAHILNQDSNTYNGDPTVVTLADVGKKYAADPSWADGVAKKLGLPNANVTMSDITSGAVPVKSADQILPANKLTQSGTVAGQPQGGVSAANQGPTSFGGALLGDNATTANPVAGQDLTTPQYSPDYSASYSPLYQANLEIVKGMSEIPWFSPDSGLITGNPRIRKNVQPIKFQVYLSQQTGEMLKDPLTGQATTLELNCSVREWNILSKHVTNRTPTRTGHHVTFWGMTPDLITGSGSTGVFMNAFGLTDYFSVADMSDDIFQQITAAFTNPQTGAIRSGNSSDFALVNLPQALRVAAQDAFTEFMKLFQMNGVVWYQPNNDKGYVDGTDQYSPTAWVPSQGTSSFQRNARANDVLTKGYVIVKYRNNTYLGYFKSLSWTIDAEKPFSWNFNFTFQVERTLTSYYFPFQGVF